MINAPIGDRRTFSARALSVIAGPTIGDRRTFLKWHAMTFWQQLAKRGESQNRLQSNVQSFFCFKQSRAGYRPPA